jgi:hypothetical protein
MKFSSRQVFVGFAIIAGLLLDSSQGWSLVISPAIISTLDGDEDAVVWAVDIGNPGTLYGIREKTGLCWWSRFYWERLPAICAFT